jgi:hypothetical protein
VGYRFQPERPGGPDEAAAFEATLREDRAVPADVSQEPPPDPELSEDEPHALGAVTAGSSLAR